MANRRMYFKGEGKETVNSSNRMASKGPLNAFANDGSFLEMFKKKMEEKSVVSGQAESVEGSPETGPRTVTENDSAPVVAPVACVSDIAENGPGESSATSTVPLPAKKSSLLSLVGKRRGGKVLPTGMVKKAKRSEDDEFQSYLKKNDRKPEACTDAWSQYMAEVKRYKERSCEDEGKTRPLVK